LPIERALEPPGGRCSFKQLASESGLDEDFLLALIRSLGLPLPIEDQPHFTQLDVEAARRAARFREAGLTDEGILEITRVMGNSLSQLVAATRSVMGDVL